MRLLSVLTLLGCLGAAHAVAQPASTQSSALPAQVAAVLKYVPDDTNLVVVVPNLDALAGGVAAFGKAIGVPDLADVNARELLSDALGKGAAALNTSGALVVALSAKHDEPLLLASLTSDESWKTTTQATALGDNVLLYEFGADRYVVASTDGVAIFAREKSELRRALEARGQFAERFAKAAGGLAGQRQVLCYVEVPAWNEQIDAQMAKLGQGMYMGMAAAGPEAEVGIQLWKWMLERFKKMVLETQTLVATARVDGQGVLLDSRVGFAPDSPLARLLKQVVRPKRDLLRGLPAGETPFVMAFDWENAPGAETFNEAMAKALLSMDSLREKVGADKLEVVVQKSIEMNRKVPGSSVAFSFSPGGKGLLYWGLYLTPEAGPVQRDMRAICELTPELMSAWGTFPTAMRVRQPEQIGGVAADVYRFDVGAESQPRQPMLEVLYGKDPTLYMAPHPDGVAYAFGPQEAARETLVKLLDPDAPPLRRDPRVTALLKALSPEPQLCVLIDIPALARCTVGLLEQCGMALPSMEMGEQKAPLAGLTFYLEPEVVRGELFVPAEPIQAIVELVEGRAGARKGAY
jgi:hypothetical protein